MGVLEDLELLERSLKQLQIEWEKFFGGVEKKPPLDCLLYTSDAADE